MATRVYDPTDPPTAGEPFSRDPCSGIVFVFSTFDDPPVPIEFATFEAVNLWRKLCKALLEVLEESPPRTIAKFSSTSAPAQSNNVFGPKRISNVPTVATMKPTAMIIINVAGVGLMDKNTIGNVTAHTNMIK